MNYENAEFQNYERELKYLLKGDAKLSVDQILDYLQRMGYKLIQTKQKEKHESYFDDANLSVIKKGDVIRGSKHITDNFSGYMYKENVSHPDKPYVSKIELGTFPTNSKYDTLEEYLQALGVDVKVLPDPVMFANMIRNTAVVEKDDERLLISYDHVDYFDKTKSKKAHEIMLEVEDWTDPNTIDNAKKTEDFHLCDANEVLLAGELPLKLTKCTKPFRGYKLLMENAECQK
jgi:hypothetical protein